MLPRPQQGLGQGREQRGTPERRERAQGHDGRDGTGGDEARGAATGHSPTMPLGARLTAPPIDGRSTACRLPTHTTTGAPNDKSINSKHTARDQHIVSGGGEAAQRFRPLASPRHSASSLALALASPPLTPTPRSLNMVSARDSSARAEPTTDTRGGEQQRRSSSLTPLVASVPAVCRCVERRRA